MDSTRWLALSFNDLITLNTMTSNTVPSDIQTFLDRYCAAFNALDGDAVASLYSTPSGIIQAGVYTNWTSAEAVAENMLALCRLYRENGFVSTNYQVNSFFAQAHEHAFVDLSWTVRRSEGLEAWRFNTSYNLMRNANGWQVVLCTAYEEKQFRSEIQKPRTNG